MQTSRERVGRRRGHIIWVAVSARSKTFMSGSLSHLKSPAARASLPTLKNPCLAIILPTTFPQMRATLPNVVSIAGGKKWARSWGGTSETMGGGDTRLSNSPYEAPSEPAGQRRMYLRREGGDVHCDVHGGKAESNSRYEGYTGLHDAHGQVLQAGNVG